VWLLAVLDPTARLRTGNQFMRRQLEPCAFTKTDLRAAVDATDDWIDANATSFNSALPAEFRTTATATQKTLLFCYIAMRRGGLLRADEDGWPVATVRVELAPEEAQFLATAFPQYAKVNGTNFPVSGLKYDAAATETAYWKLPAFDYGSGNLTLDILWYADTATSGVVRWEAAVAAITPETDTQDVETKAFATALAVDDTHLGTTGQRVHKATVTISNLDSLAALDVVWLKVARLGGHANDTMTGDSVLISVWLSYSDV
jgi:hypothetical protein